MQATPEKFDQPSRGSLACCIRCDRDPFIPGLTLEIIEKELCKVCGGPLHSFYFEEVA